ncbi:MAG: alpha/beta fold hydrolase BchO [Pseudomonadota bacterium]
MFGPSAPPDWETVGARWPHREKSAFVDAAGLRWHVQRFGDEALPTLLMVHGSGGATHSFRGLAPLLADRFHVIVPDLPGHGFTAARVGPTLPRTARDVAALLRALNRDADVVIGHSAGAAVAARMTLDDLAAPRALVAINGAFYPFPGAAGTIFPIMAKMLFLNPVVPSVFAWGAQDRRRVEKLIGDTGSTLDEQGLDAYHALIRSPGHCRGALAQMAHWNLEPLLDDIGRLKTPLLAVVAENDKTIAPSDVERLSARLPSVTVERLPALGHLAHEEDPAATLAAMGSFLAKS